LTKPDIFRDTWNGCKTAPIPLKPSVRLWAESQRHSGPSSSERTFANARGNDPARFDSGVGGFLRPYRLTEVLPGLDQDEAVNGCNGLEILETHEFQLFYPENKGIEACKSTS
jgi:hypothetical protein